jgi:hypothetical protein
VLGPPLDEVLVPGEHGVNQLVHHVLFRRDIGNAKTAKLFNAGKDNILSHHGEAYVDALPDRQAAAALRKGKGRRKKGARKKKTS